MHDELGKRIKENYENRSKTYLTRRIPVIIRVDGRAFHTFTKGFSKPFDNLLVETMIETAKQMCANIMGCKIAYVQSDEISLLLTDYEKLTTEGWFDYNVQKITSISASMATLYFNEIFRDKVLEIRKNNPNDSDSCYRNNDYTIKKAMFDSRAFNLPKEEVTNYFVWRQQDATRNSIQMVGHYYFSQKEMDGKNVNEVQDMLFINHAVNFNNLPTYLKRGTCISKEQRILPHPINKDETVKRNVWTVDYDIPIFTQDRQYIELEI